jgi:hypothetical protein
MSVIPALRLLKQEGLEFEASLGYIARLKHEALSPYSSSPSNKPTKQILFLETVLRVQ